MYFPAMSCRSFPAVWLDQLRSWWSPEEACVLIYSNRPDPSLKQGVGSASLKHMLVWRSGYLKKEWGSCWKGGEGDETNTLAMMRAAVETWVMWLGGSNACESAGGCGQWQEARCWQGDHAGPQEKGHLKKPLAAVFSCGSGLYILRTWGFIQNSVMYGVV